MVATSTPLMTRSQVVQYVTDRAPQLGLDPVAVLAVASKEGLNSTPGSYWSDPPGVAFGPPSWNTAGAGYPILAGGLGVQAQGSVFNAAQWSWTPAGIDYWLNQVASSKGTVGATGANAVSAIVNNFEHPANPNKEVSDAIAALPAIQAEVGSSPMPGTLPLQIPVPVPGQPGPVAPGPITTDPTVPNTSTTTATPFSLHLFSTPNGPVNLTLPWDFSGILLFLMAVFAIIIGALMWDKTRNVIVKGGETAAVVAA